MARGRRVHGGQFAQSGQAEAQADEEAARNIDQSPRKSTVLVSAVLPQDQ